jgi:type I restriction enzyme M protein
MALKKSDLYSSLWKSCDELRGGMDASQYKDYVLTLLFVKYVSDKYAGRTDSIVTVPVGGGFADMVAAKNKTDIGDRINKIIAKLAEENELKGVIDLTDFNDEEKLGKGKDMVDRLTKLVGIFENPDLNFGKNRSDDDDILGDAYEYLMRHFATESGKSKGQFYTPAEVSRILANVIGVEHSTARSQSVYDPTCGSGSLLLKVVDAAPVGLTIYGQENDNATKALAVMNMWLHGHPGSEIWKGNTLSEPHFLDHGNLKQFDYVVANPPFSQKNWKTGFDAGNDLYGRFTGYGLPPEKNGDYAFLLHILKSMKSTATAACILPHGVLFRGNAEAVIRQNLVERKVIKGIIGLPANLFYGTGIPACIIVLDKAGADKRKGIFIIDASKGYLKDGNKNRLREQDIHRISDVFTAQQAIPGLSRLVPFDEIEKNDFNLNIPRYIDSTEAEDIQDLSAHLQGGIPDRDIEALARYWSVYPGLRKELFKPNTRKGYSDLKVPADQVRATIFGHSEFTTYAKELESVFGQWRKAHEPELRAIAKGVKPRVFIRALSDSLLAAYQGKALIDPYTMYQHLLDHWNSTLKDDVYMLVEDGWRAVPEPVTDKKTGKVKKGQYTCDLVPQPLIIARYFAKEQAKLEELQRSNEALGQQLEELLEEHSGEEGILADATNEKGTVTKSSLKSRFMDIADNPEYAAEVKVIKQVDKLMDAEAKAKKTAKQAAEALDAAAWKHYAKLTEADVKELVVNDKWLADLYAALTGEQDRISQRLAGRIAELAERYAHTLPELDHEMEALTAKVEAHLKQMELQWN